MPFINIFYNYYKNKKNEFYDSQIRRIFNIKLNFSNF